MPLFGGKQGFYSKSKDKNQKKQKNKKNTKKK